MIYLLLIPICVLAIGCICFYTYALRFQWPKRWITWGFFTAGAFCQITMLLLAARLPS